VNAEWACHRAVERAGAPDDHDRTPPVILVQGTADWVAMGQTVRYLPLIPRSRFRPLLAAGHAPQSDRPDTIVRLVDRTAKQAAAADAAGTLPEEAAADAA
jgi:pimeloyl-ACP methyl ester carboxylesterase